MRQVRFGVFETNSSSTHCLVICTQEEYQQFQENELMYDSYDEKLVPYTQLLINAEGYRYQSYRDFGRDLERFHHTFTTPSGDQMVAFGGFGYDG